MKVQLSQIEDFESAPSRIKIQWKERKNGRTIFNGTESLTKIIHTNFEKEVKMVIDDYKYLIKTMLNSLNKINDETKFE